MAAEASGGELEFGAGKKGRDGFLQRLTSFICKGPDNKYFQLCGPTIYLAST